MENKQDDVVRVICEKTEASGDILKWAAQHDKLQVFSDVYRYHQGGDMEDLYKSSGEGDYLDIVTFVIEECGAELLDYGEGDFSCPCPLVAAIEHGKREIIGYLYAHDNEYEDESFVPAFCGAAA